ncbi:alpha/beta hydrolase [Kineosporia succinea]|uniref:Acetyl esterase/lipase n=1 Tax=Kineosporia succinea TaxID=84632 RepID=A0ABT9PD95_9ACTN|nr:alpha/beta hydrolase [Kineosporia succinea]MDP9830678.1 acetyl esterase/lipase [Kineosporia succinea]
MSVVTEDHVVPGPHGAVPVRFHRPSEPTDAALVWAHGGAWVGGDLEMPESDWVARQLACRGVTVLTVDYRLAPLPDWMANGLASNLAPRPAQNHPYPVASQELTAVFRWATRAEPGLRWTLGGASAGGNLAAGAALRLRDEGDQADPGEADPGDEGAVQPVSLLLVYPVAHAELPPLTPELEDRARQHPELDEFRPEAVTAMNLNYVRDAERLADAYAFPGGHDLSALPPTFVLTSDLDLLRASGQAFGAELAAAGVDVLVVRENGARHGHLNVPDDPAAARSIERIANWLLSPLHRPR